VVVRELITLLGFQLEDGPQKQYDRQIDATKAKSNGLATAAKGVGTAFKWAAAAVAVGVGFISKNIIDATIEIEGYKTQMQAFTGSAEAAAEALSDLRGKTGDALFGTGNMVSAYKQLRTVGMGAEETSKMIDVLGDVANGSAENFSSLGNILTRVSTTGKVDTAVMRQLTNAGFGMQDMAQGLGISVQKLESDLKEGKLGFNDLTKAMAASTAEGGRFYGNMANQAMTLGGSIKILKSLIGDIGVAIGTGVIPVLVDFIRYIGDLVKAGKEGLIGFGQKAFETLIRMIIRVIIFFEVLQMRMRKYGGAFTALKGIFSDVFGFFQDVLKSVWPALMNLALLILVAFKPIRAFVQPILEALKPLIRSVFGTLSSIIERLIPIVNGLTPLFGGLGKVIGVLLGPILGVAVAIKGINTAIAIGKGAIAGIKAVQTAYGLLAGTMSIMKAAADGNRLAMFLLDAQMLKSKIAAIAYAAATKVVAIATKIWAGIQAVFNAIMALNPVVLIVMAVIALIAAIVLLVKNWDTVAPAVLKALSAIGNFFKMIGSAIANFFKWLWNAVVGVFNKIVEFVKKNALNIANVLLLLLFLPAGIIMAVVRLVIKHWDKIKPALIKIFTFVVSKFKAIFGKVVDIVKALVQKIKNVWNAVKGWFVSLWNGIVSVAIAAWEKVKGFFGGLVEVIKNIWNTATEFFSGLWDGIKDIAATVWEGIKNVFFAVVDAIKNGLQNFVKFFSGLFSLIGEAASGVWNRIKESFIAVFDGIKEKFFAFINVIQAGWEKVKGFFGGVVNFVSGGDIGKGESGGSGSAGSVGSSQAVTKPLVTAAATSAAARTTNTYGGANNTVNAQTSINVNVPPGTTAEQAKVISQQVEWAMQNSLASAINGSRGNISSPEARRN